MPLLSADTMYTLSVIHLNCHLDLGNIDRDVCMCIRAISTCITVAAAVYSEQDYMNTVFHMRKIFFTKTNKNCDIV